MCFQLEKLMKEHDDKLKDADKEPLQQGDREDAAKRPRATTPQAIKSAIEELEQASHAFSKASTRQAAAAGDGSGTRAPLLPASCGRSGGDDDDAIDAEFEVKDS